MKIRPFREMQIRQAKRIRQKSLSKFIAVTGSSGKSTTVSLLSHIIEGYAPIKSQYMHNTIKPLIKTIRQHRQEELFVVAELGVGGKGQMAQMADIIKPDVAILTMIGDEHYSSFRGREGVFNEKNKLFKSLQSNGLAILNGDDNYGLKISKQTACRSVTFGNNNPNTDYRVKDISASIPELLSFTIKNKKFEIKLQTQFPGEQFWMPVTAAVVAALELRVPIEIIKEKVKTFYPVVGRCSIHQIPDGPCFILDTAKAPYSTLSLAFDMLKNKKLYRKRIIIGTISDYAGSRSNRYRKAWKYARECADQVIFVGSESSSIKPNIEDILNGRIIFCKTPEDAFEYIKKTSIPNEVILIKGSRNLHLERLMLAFKKKVLCWEPSCKVGENCFTCPGISWKFNNKKIKRVLKKQHFKAKFSIPFIPI